MSISATLTAAADPTAPPTPRHRPGVGAAVGWELTKLAAQARARWTLLGCAIAPALIVVVLHQQQRPPKDTLYGRYIHESGYAVPLLVLGFAAQWVLPLLTALVAGDIFASEDQHGTWKTVLTRSVSRTQMFWAKTTTAALFAVAAWALLTISTVAASLLVVGHQPLVGLTGQLIDPVTAFELVMASWATALAPLLGFTSLAILLSVRARNPSVGIAAPVVLGMVMQLIGSLGGLEGIRKLLLTTPFESWHGLLAQDRFYGPLILGLVVSAAWSAVCLGGAFVFLSRRDITGG